MKHITWLIPLVVLLALAGCAVDGAVYLSFDWEYWRYTPYNYTTTDPNLPASAIYRNTDYWTEPGDYYFSYWVNTGIPTRYWIYYTLTAKPGAFPGGVGEDSRFLLYLYDGWPGFVQLQSLVSASEGAAGGPTGAQAIPAAAAPEAEPEGFVRKQLGEYRLTQGRYTLTVRTGVWAPKE